MTDDEDFFLKKLSHVVENLSDEDEIVMAHTVYVSPVQELATPLVRYTRLVEDTMHTLTV